MQLLTVSYTKQHRKNEAVFLWLTTWPLEITRDHYDKSMCQIQAAGASLM